MNEDDHRSQLEIEPPDSLGTDHNSWHRKVMKVEEKGKTNIHASDGDWKKNRAKEKCS